MKGQTDRDRLRFRPVFKTIPPMIVLCMWSVGQLSVIYETQTNTFITHVLNQ